MSNKRRPRRSAAKQEHPERREDAGQSARSPTPAQIRSSMHHLERRAHVVRAPELELSDVSRRREQKWSLSTLGRDHGNDRGVTITVSSKRLTAAGLLKAHVSHASGKARRGDLVRIIHAPTGAAGAAHVRRVVERTGQIYLEPHWGAAIEKPLFRTQADARAEAREVPYACPSCGAEPGDDCATQSGKRAQWPHAARDPILSKNVRELLTPANLR